LSASLVTNVAGEKLLLPLDAGFLGQTSKRLMLRSRRAFLSDEETNDGRQDIGPAALFGMFGIALAAPD
jgi:hypothetical protein